MSNKLDRRKTSFVIFIFTMIFFYLPLIVLIIYSFNDGKGMVWNGFDRCGVEYSGVEWLVMIDMVWC